MAEIYTPRDIRRAINLSAFLGWFAFSVPALWDRIELYPYAALLGLPIAYAGCWLIGTPVLRRTTKRPLSFVRAGVVGGLIAALLALASIIIGRLNGLLMYLDDSRSSTYYHGFTLQSQDGILTPFGWWIVLQNSLIFIAIGVCIGLVVRALLGPGRSRPAE